MGVTQNITALIDYYGMTHRTFAKRIGKTQSAVSQWLVGGDAIAGRVEAEVLNHHAKKPPAETRGELYRTVAVSRDFRRF